MTIRVWKYIFVLAAVVICARSANCQDSKSEGPMDLVQRLAEVWNTRDFQGLMDLIPAEPARPDGFSRERDAEAAKLLIQVGLNMSIEHAETVLGGDMPYVTGIQWIDPFGVAIRNLTVYLQQEDGVWRIADIAAERSGTTVSQLSLDDAFTQLSTYDFGFDSRCTSVIASAVRLANGDDVLLASLRSRLVDVLRQDVPTGAKDFVCRQMALIGDESSVSALAALLQQDSLCHIALAALEQLPSEAVDRALIEAAGQADGRFRQDIIDALGDRKCAEAIGLLSDFAAMPAEDAAAAAVVALGKIGTPEAYRAIEGVFGRRAELPETVVKACWNAMLVHADALATGDAQADAIALYDRLLDQEAPPQIRAAAFIGKVVTTGEEALPWVISTLEGEDQVLAAAAAQSARRLPGQHATEDFLKSLQKLSLPLQVRLIGALGDRGDTTATESIIPFLTYPDTEARLAAAEALSKIGGVSCLGPLVSMAAWAPDSAERDVARDALTIIRGPEISRSLRGLLFTEPPESVREVIQILETRLAVDAVPDLIRLAFYNNVELNARSYGLRALGRLAAPEQFEFIVALLQSPIEEWLRGDLEQAIIEAAGRVPEPGRVREVLAGALGSNPRIAARCSLFRVMGSIGDEEFLPVLRAAAQDAEPAIRDTAIRALADWPRISVLEPLAELMRSDSDNTHRVIAARGLLRLLAADNDIDGDTKLAYCREALEIAETVDEKRIILGAFAQMQVIDALELIEPLTSVPELRDDANFAMHRIVFRNAKPLATKNSAMAPFAIDGDLNSRWSTVEPQEGGAYFGLDLGAEYEISTVVLDAGTSLNDYPRAFEVRVADSADYAQSRPIAEAQGANTIVRVSFEPVHARALWITITAPEAAPWSIHELSFLDLESGNSGIHFVRR